MKAWIVTDEYAEYSTVVFAKTRSQARTIAQATDCCEDTDYINIKPRRFKEADARYCGKREMDWDDPDDRRFFVKHGWHGWGCVEHDNCPECPAADICEKYLDYKKEVEADQTMAQQHNKEQER